MSTDSLLVIYPQFIAQKILDINERGTFMKPVPEDKVARQAQDDEIFHRARLVNCGYFMHIILGGMYASRSTQISMFDVRLLL